MSRVVYFLGAGFSQPLGVPTIGEFLDKAKDQQARQQDRFGYFQPLLSRLEGLYKAGTFFESDMTNIEEVLSLLEADAFVNEPNLKEQFVKFICDVVRFYTPPILPLSGPLPGNWQGFVFGDQREKWNPYGYFTLALLNLQLGIDSTRKVVVSDENGPANTYSVVTTNYDLALESVCDYAQKTGNLLSGGEKVAFRRASAKREIGSGKASLAKLHGSVDDCDIVPPTWSKGATPEYAKPWNMALEVLSQAQEIRIIGYSLPEGDSYVRYLLKAAAIRNPDLRKVHVLCWDPDNKGQVEERYERFVKRGFLFKNMDSSDYLNNLLGRIVSGDQGSLTYLLERTHATFFGLR